MKTFSIQTLGCKVNQYETEQIAALLCQQGLLPAAAAEADLRIINTCSVTVQAASKSRQATRRAASLPTPAQPRLAPRRVSLGQLTGVTSSGGRSCETIDDPSHVDRTLTDPFDAPVPTPARKARVVVTGCWATSDPAAARALVGVDAVIGHHDDVASDLLRLIRQWRFEPTSTPPPAEPDQGSPPPFASPHHSNGPIKKGADDAGWGNQAGSPGGKSSRVIESSTGPEVNEKMTVSPAAAGPISPSKGTWGLPLLGERQAGRQRAHLKIQDGCDAHCTYCIIPRLRPSLGSKPIDDAVEEAGRLTAAGHVEIVLTGIFLGAYGQPTALRRRQPPAERSPLAGLIDALCARVPGLRRLRLSSLEPGDLTDDLVAVLRSHAQVVPHFHLPLQSGSDALLRRMNRQYTRDDYLTMIDRVRRSFDRPALTTDIIVGFPGEEDAAFAQTAEVAQAAGFIHIHAFPFSPRPGTAAARWKSDFVHGPVVNDRITHLREIAAAHSLRFRKQFIGEAAELLVELDDGEGRCPSSIPDPHTRHGRTERYFSVRFKSTHALPGDLARVRIERVDGEETYGVQAI